MLGAGIRSALAMSARSGNTPCECVHTCSLPSFHCATAHDGPIEACAWYGRVYSAESVVAVGARSAAPPFSLTTVVWARADFMAVNSAAPRGGSAPVLSQ